MRYFRLENSSFDSEKIVEQRRKINEQNIKAYRQSVRTSIIVAIVFFVAFIIAWMGGIFNRFLGKSGEDTVIFRSCTNANNRCLTFWGS